MDELEKMIKEINVEENLKAIDESIDFEELDNLWNDNLEELDKEWALKTLEELNNFRY